MARRRNPKKISGRRRLIRTLKALPDDLTEAIRAEVMAGAGEIETRAKQLVPVDTGELQRLITKKVSKDGLNAKVGIQGKKARRDGWYAKFVEFGTKAWSQVLHFQATGKRQKLDIRKSSARAQLRREVRASGPAQPARPFIGRAIRELAPDLIKRMDKAVGETLKQAARGAKNGSD